MSIHAFNFRRKLRMMISNFPVKHYGKAHVPRMQDERRNEKNKIL